MKPKRTIASVCKAWTKRDIVQLTIKDMENFEASKLSSGDTNIEEKKECLSAFEQIMLHAKSDYERLRDGWKPGTPQYESYDLVVRECVKIMTIYSATTPRPVQEKPDFKREAENKYPTPYVCEGTDITPAYRDGFEDGCEYIWKNYVEKQPKV